MGIGFTVSPEALILFAVLPMSAYSFADPVAGQSSTSWLLDQADDFQQLHIPVPYEQPPIPLQPRPPFLTPAEFGDPLQMGWWKHSKPSWVQAVPQTVGLKYTTTVNILNLLEVDTHTDVSVSV